MAGYKIQKFRILRSIWVPVTGTLLLFTYLLWDFFPPSVICAEDYFLNGIDCRRLPDLVVQGHCPDDNLWATRGLWAYRINKNGDCFHRVYRIPTGKTGYWLFNFSIIRRLTGRVQNVELLPLSEEAAIAISAGWIWHRQAEKGSFKRVKRLRHYGIGTGRGVLAAGLVGLSDGRVMLGEYSTNPDRKNVRVYVSNSYDYQNWEIAHEFPAGQIRHIHAVQEDPYTDMIWVFTGDRDAESIVMTIDTSGKKKLVGSGAQCWRVVQAVFTKNAVYWGADTGGPEGGIWRLERNSGELLRLNTIHGAVYYANRLSDGTLVFAHAVEEVDDLKDNKARLWILYDNNEPWPIILGTQIKPTLARVYEL